MGIYRSNMENKYYEMLLKAINKLEKEVDDIDDILDELILIGETYE